MLFPTLAFLGFFLVVAALSAALDRHFTAKKLMLTVASPIEDRTHIAVRGYGIQRKIEKARSERRRRLPGTPVTIVVGYPDAVPADAVERPVLLFVKEAQEQRALNDPKLIRGPGFSNLQRIHARDASNC